MTFPQRMAVGSTKAVTAMTGRSPEGFLRIMEKKYSRRQGPGVKRNLTKPFHGTTPPPDHTNQAKNAEPFVPIHLHSSSACVQSAFRVRESGGGNVCAAC